MKLKLLREHYVSKNNGNTWSPKLTFKTVEEIREAGFYPANWHHYKCGYCGNLHISSIKTVKEPKNDK